MSNINQNKLTIAENDYISKDNHLNRTVLHFNPNANYRNMQPDLENLEISPYLPFHELLETLIESRDNGIFEFLKASETHLEQRIKRGEEYLRPNLIRLQKEHANLVKTMREQKS